VIFLDPATGLECPTCPECGSIMVTRPSGPRCNNCGPREHDARPSHPLTWLEMWRDIGMYVVMRAQAKWVDKPRRKR
jgi:hypothetical protein